MSECCGMMESTASFSAVRLIVSVGMPVQASRNLICLDSLINNVIWQAEVQHHRIAMYDNCHLEKRMARNEDGA